MKISDILKEYHLSNNFMSEDMKKKEELQKKMINLFYEVLWDIVYLLLLLWIIVGNQNQNVFRQNNSLTNMFSEDLDDVSIFCLYH